MNSIESNILHDQAKMTRNNPMPSSVNRTPVIKVQINGYRWQFFASSAFYSFLMLWWLASTADDLLGIKCWTGEVKPAYTEEEHYNCN
jgi:hypothetical protein